MLTFNRFEGMTRRVDAPALADGLAQDAVNAGFSRGSLAAVPLDFSEISLSDLKSTVVNGGSFASAGGVFYSHMADAWFVWSEGTQVKRGVDSLIAPQDTWERVYFADQNGPRYMTSDQYTKDAVNVDPTSYRLGVPFPAQPATVTKDSETIPGDVDESDVVRQQVAYQFTLVDDYGHEGPPSESSDSIEVPIEYDFQATVTIPHNGTDLSGRPFGANAKKRVYRATEGSESAQFQYIGETDLSNTTFVDTVPYGNEGETMLSVQWFEPPAEIKEIAAVASNFLAGFYDHMVCFSEPKLPHAWPLRFRFPIRYKIVGINSTANGLFIGTTGKPYWCFGGDPEAAIPVEINRDYPCVSADSIVDVGGYIVYASHDGLVAVDGQDAILITDPLFTHEDWQTLQPETIKAFVYEGRYIFYSVQSNELFAMYPEDNRTMTRLEWSGDMTLFAEMLASEYSLRYDRTVLTFPNTASIALLELKDDYPVSTEWVSREQLSFPMTFNFIRVRASTFPITVTISSKGNSDVTMEVENERPVRLPRFSTKSRLWGISIAFDGSGAGVVRDVSLAKSSEEFSNVA